MSVFDCVVIGGGVAGLACARRISSQGKSVLLVERSTHLGGRVRTIAVGGRDVEVGAQFVTNFYSSFWRFIRPSDGVFDSMPLRVGLAHDSQVSTVTSWIGHPRHLLELGRCFPAILGGLLSALRHWGQLDPSRLWQAALLDRGTLKNNRSTSYRALVSSFIAPAIRHFLYWETRSTSSAFLPILIKAALITRFVSRPQEGFSHLAVSLGRGLETLTGEEVVGLTQGDDRIFRVQLLGGRTLHCRSVALCTDGITARGLLSSLPLHAAIQQYLQQLSYSSTTVVSGYFEGWEPRFSTLVNLSGSESGLAAVTLEVVDEGCVLSAFLSSDAAEATSRLQQVAVTEYTVALLRSELGDFMPVDPGSGWQVQRWERALPRFDQGSFRLLREARAALEDSEAMLTLAGDYLSGPFIEGAVESGLSAGDRLLRMLAQGPGDAQNR